MTSREPQIPEWQLTTLDRASKKGEGQLGILIMHTVAAAHTFVSMLEATTWFKLSYPLVEDGPRPPHDVANAAHAAPGCFGLASNGNTWATQPPASGGLSLVPTPEVLRRLLAITSEDEPGMTREKAAARSQELAQEAQEGVQRGTSSQPSTVLQPHENLGPPVEVAPADGSQPWKKPSGSAWCAERKGDSRKCVFRVNVPGEDTASGKGKPKYMSLQVLVGGRELSVTAFKSLMTKFGGNFILMFGPQKSIQVNQTCAAGFDLTKFWGK
eukprot:s849_g19.t1